MNLPIDFKNPNEETKSLRLLSNICDWEIYRLDYGFCLFMTFTFGFLGDLCPNL
jgi:hypothetical protein